MANRTADLLWRISYSRRLEASGTIPVGAYQGFYCFLRRLEASGTIPVGETIPCAPTGGQRYLVR